MAPAPEPPNSPSDLEAIVEKALSSASTLPRFQRHVVGAITFAGYLGLGVFRSGFAAIFLAVAFYGVLQRWVIEEPKPQQIPDAYIWAGVSLITAAIAFAIWWWYIGPASLQRWSTHIWLPLGIVGVALALDRYRRPPTPAGSIGKALADARRRSARRPPPSSPGPEA
jgi:hypothetical protein